MNKLIRGRIKSLKTNFGFIEGADGTDYFFHWTMLATTSKTFRQLEEGFTVEFRPEVVDDKPRAQDIISID